MNVHFLGESHHAHAHKPIDTRFICSLLDDTHPTFVIANFSQFLILTSVVTMARLPIVFERQILTNTYSHSPTHTQRAHTHTLRQIHCTWTWIRTIETVSGIK